MTNRLILTLLFLANCISAQHTLAQNRLDIAFEGPWLFYQAPAFAFNGGTFPALIAVAPQLSDHFPPTFSTGDDVNFDIGTYCVGFNATCKTNNATTLNKDGYTDPSLLHVNKGNWDWTSLPSAYVLVVPLPDSYSADGQYSITLQSSFPKPNTVYPTPTKVPAALGIQLHYNNGPDSISLFKCSSGAATASNCNTSLSNQVNSGTLRITIKSDQDPKIAEPCEYHVRRAFHKMIHLLDPPLTSNPNSAYINAPSYDSKCSPCDPQQDVLPSDCTGMTMGNDFDYSPAALNISGGLEELVSFLTKLGLDKENNTKVALEALRGEATSIGKQLPKQSQLEQLSIDLDNFSNGLNKLLQADDNAKLQNHEKANVDGDRDANLQNAELQVQGLQLAVYKAFAANSGKDCRSPEMLIQ